MTEESEVRELMKRTLATEFRRDERWLARIRRGAERKLLARRRQRAIALARRLYLQGARRAECAERTGLSLKTVMRITVDIRAARAAQTKGRS